MTEIFVRATGQAENLGDSVLRRPILQFLRPLGHLNVLLRQLPATYTSGLALAATDSVYASEKEWISSAVEASKGTRVVFAFNPGEIQFNRFYASAYWRSLPAVRAARRSGGAALHLGIGVRNPSSRWKHLITPVVAACSTVAWRDSESAEATRLGSVMPDWAFLEGADDRVLESAVPSDRNLMSITFRGDRPPLAPQEIDSIVEFARLRRLEPRVYAQVGRDVDPMRRLASQLDAPLVEVPSDTDHAVQEPIVRSLQRESAVVLSDRLHALVMGATEGAVPMVLNGDRSRKARAHFRAAGVNLSDISRDVDLKERDEFLPREVLLARTEIRNLMDSVREQMST